MFVWGLNSVKNHSGVISSLDLRRIQASYLKAFPQEILGGSLVLKIVGWSKIGSLPHVLSSMESLKSLALFPTSGHNNIIPAVLRSLNNGVRNLTLLRANISSPHFSTSLRQAVNGR
jgi:hypothetical protein